MLLSPLCSPLFPYTTLFRSLLIKDSVNAIGFQVACYYSLAGFACAWHFRSTAFKSLESAVFLFLWPVVSSVFLVFIACYRDRKSTRLNSSHMSISYAVCCLK